jgi:hypothetical protein
MGHRDNLLTIRVWIHKREAVASFNLPFVSQSLLRSSLGSGRVVDCDENLGEESTVQARDDAREVISSIRP